ncbi:hypothetical protein AMAG_12339 [Allomyces macrogynus ATCC 38327]|uniref:F-box domain-containing protein n=1 Tax=Allomyces macrogynus (strain ATCC 38327) TaxID=578462 RepID=A0A0L0SXI3_ALLM3|nr:hypothetical protein AMAG_12339 [Allomyces macrogynus ATCC 38327]|eukprot:KNE67273.1 hypothetical protein AMAG_12339 [Allomyces macrogynus ATCC 38327]
MTRNDATTPPHAPELISLPHDLLILIAKRVLNNDPDGSRLSLLCLALAAPALYAPCLYAAIRNGPVNNKTTLEFAAPGLVCTPRLESLGRLVAVQDLVTQHVEWYLTLFPRDENRNSLPLVEKEPASRKWTLLHVPVRQLRRFTICIDPMSTLIPPHCQRLTLVGKLSWDHVKNLPDSLKKLLVMNCVLPNENKISEVFAHFPRHLTTLVMLEAFPADAGQVLNFFVNALPTTLTTVSIVANEFHSFEIYAIARLVSQLPSLKSFLLQGRKIMDLETLVAELPRTGLKQLILRAQKLVDLNDEVAGMFGAGGMFTGVGGLGMEVDEEEEEGGVSLLACVAEKLPSSVEYLELMLPYDNKATEFTAKVPLATRQLVLFVTNWTPAMLAQVPIAPTVERVVLQSKTAVDLSLFLRRLPVSVKDLDLSGFPLNSLDVVMSVAQHLPPSLVWLSLKNCRLNAANVARFAGLWPVGLNTLDLRGNGFDTPPPGLPAGLRPMLR